MAGIPIDILSGVRFYIDDHTGAAPSSWGAPTSDVLEVTGRPAEDFETIARRCAVLPHNQRTLGNRVREFTRFLITPFSPAFNFGRYDRELRRPWPSEPQFAPESKVWQRERGATGLANSASSVQQKAGSAISRPQSLASQ